MFDPNEDIEDLYRRAADRFDLESSGPDWEKMSRTLDKLSAPASTPGEVGVFRRLMMGGSRFVPLGITAAVVIGAVVTSVLLLGKQDSGRPNVATANATSGNSISAAGNGAAGNSTGQGGSGAGQAGDLTGSAGKAATENAVGSSALETTNSTTAGSGIPASSLAAARHGRPSTGRGRSAGGGRSADSQTSADNGASGDPAQNGAFGDQETFLDIPLTTNSDLPSALEQVRISTDRLQLKASPPPLALGASAGTGPVVSPLRRGGRFSAGLSGALDLSFIDGQALSQPGGSGGILAGFQATRRINLETGIYVTHKVYYTNGPHIPRVPVPFGSKLLNATAHVSLFEIPLTLRYSIVANRLGVFYAGAGITSYLVNSEAYSYQYKTMWSGKEKQAHWAYHGKIPQHILSAISANIGYLWNVGKTDALRTEVYGKLPLSGIGKFSIPVTSTGLSLSFLHSF